MVDGSLFQRRSLLAFSHPSVPKKAHKSRGVFFLPCNGCLNLSASATVLQILLILDTVKVLVSCGVLLVTLAGDQ